MRKEFEKLPEIARLIEKRNMIFNEEIGRYGALGYADHLSLIDDISFVSGAWYAWQAKAQAVPSKLDEINNWAKWHIEDYQISESNEHDRGWYNACCAVVNMLEAQEQNQ